MGKTKTMTQMAAVVLLILQRPYPALVPFADAGGRRRDHLHGRQRTRLHVAVPARPVACGRRDRQPWRGATGAVAGRSARPRAGQPPDARAGSPCRSRSRAREVCSGLSSPTSRGAPPISSAASSPTPTRSSARSSACRPTCSTSHGAVSREVAIAMAEGARSKFGTTSLAASVTGIAGPDAEGRQTGRPHLHRRGDATAAPPATSIRFKGDRWSNRREAADEALRLLLEAARSNVGKLAS